MLIASDVRIGAGVPFEDSGENEFKEEREDLKLELSVSILVFLVGIGSAFIQRVSGFGQGIFVMLFLPHFLPSHTASAAISGLFSCITNSYNAWKYKKQIAFRIILPPLAAGFVTIPIAVHYSVKISGQVFHMVLGVVLICLSIYFLLFSKRMKIRPTVPGGLFAGALGGTLSGLFSTGGPPIVLYLTQATEGKLIYFASIQFYFCMTGLYSTAVRIVNGVLTAELMVYAAIGLVGCMIGDTFGKKVFDKIDAEMLKKIIYIGMIISGILMIF